MGTEFKKALREGFFKTKKVQRVPVNKKYIRSLKEKTRKRGNDMCCEDPGFCKNPTIPDDRRPLRKFMPQLGTLALQKKADGILPAPHRTIDIFINKLLFSQREINSEIVEGIAFSMERELEKGKSVVNPGNKAPIVVFEDNGKFTVCDGHHRTAAVKLLVKKGLLPKKTKIKAHVYSMDPELGLLILNSTGFNKRPEKF
jgi:hypothetical protein